LRHPCTWDVARLSESVKIHVLSTLSESLATSLVHGSRNPARKTIRYPFIPGHVRGYVSTEAEGET
jgi:hypothetical protein